jgi:hypothetical protein
MSTLKEVDISRPSADSVKPGSCLNLNSSHGCNFSKDVRQKFGLAVHPLERSGHFMMVVSFGRAAFRLDDESVAIALELVIGGHADKLKVSALSDRVFSFCVSSKQVGFHILKLRMYRCLNFKCFFHLWGRGEPNWAREFECWQRECQSEWILVSPNKKRAQLAMQVMKKTVPKPIVKTKQVEGKKLNFADSLSYPACKGYTDPIVAVQSECIQHRTENGLESVQEIIGPSVVNPIIPPNNMSRVGLLGSPMSLKKEKERFFRWERTMRISPGVLMGLMK